MAFEDVVVAGIGETEKHRPSRRNDQPYHTLEEYFRMAADLTLADAGLEWGDVDGLGVARPSTETPYRYRPVSTDCRCGGTASTRTDPSGTGGPCRRRPEPDTDKLAGT